MDKELRSAIEAAIRAARGTAFTLRSAQAASGGCIHESHVVEGSGERYFAKTNRQTLSDAFEAEADGLDALGRAGARVPAVVARGASGSHAFLVLEHLELRPGNDAAHERLGQMLAHLHMRSAAGFGWHRDNYIGATPQRNARHGRWSEFWRDERLMPQLELAATNGHTVLAAPGSRLCASIDRVLADEPRGALLHGDLWNGNAGFLADGTPVLFDPAVYEGDADADIAMTELFGGFPARFYAAYREAIPARDGYEMRKTLYNLYHVLNHANLFGGGYAAQAARMMERLLAATR